MRSVHLDRTIACYGALGAWGLLLLVVVRYLVGPRTFALSVFFPTPLTLPILIVALPLVLIGLGVLVASVHDSVISRSARGLVLGLATWAVIALVVNEIAGFVEEAALPPGWLEAVVWIWALGLLLHTGWWFRRPPSARNPRPGETR